MIKMQFYSTCRYMTLFLALPNTFQSFSSYVRILREYTRCTAKRDEASEQETPVVKAKRTATRANLINCWHCVYAPRSTLLILNIPSVILFIDENEECKKMHSHTFTRPHTRRWKKNGGFLWCVRCVYIGWANDIFVSVLIFRSCRI